MAWNMWAASPLFCSSSSASKSIRLRYALHNHILNIQRVGRYTGRRDLRYPPSIVLVFILIVVVIALLLLLLFDHKAIVEPVWQFRDHVVADEAGKLIALGIAIFDSANSSRIVVVIVVIQIVVVCSVSSVATTAIK